jgi:pimeloyl-ACP methyl ester carboxylesterase
VKAANGRFPVLLFSHGLHSSPESYATVTRRIAAAGFIVAAPDYPFTSTTSVSFNAGDLGNQPADASYVITQILALDKRAGDLLRGHVNTAQVAAGGHSAGGYTTVGMLCGGTRDTRLKAAIVLSGAGLGGSLTGPVTPTLFIHGTADQTVAYSSGRAVWSSMPWPKGFMTIVGGGHPSSAFGPLANADIATMIDFLRWTLYGDAFAKRRLVHDASVPGQTKWESTL